MTESLTESFCERCGTRYEFKAPTRLNPLRKTKGFVGGLRNYLTSQDALSDAIGDAMRSQEDGLASAQLEAFHESFNFCIDCRQYTCVNCWNDNAGRCRSCVPIPGTDDLTERLAAAMTAPAAAGGQPIGEAPDARGLELEPWPTSDLPTLPAVSGNGQGVEGWPVAEFADGDAAAQTPVAPEFESEPAFAELEPEPVIAEPEPTFAEPEPEPLVADVEPEPILAELEPEPEPVSATLEPEPAIAKFEEPVAAEAEPEPIAAEIELEPVRLPLRVVAWDEDAAFELVEAEPVVAEMEPEAEPVVAEIEPEAEPVVAEMEPEAEPVVAEVEPEAEPVVAEVEPEAEPVVAEMEPEAEPVVAEVEPEPELPRFRIPTIRDTILPFPTPPSAEEQRQAAAAEGPDVAARRAQLDDLGLGPTHGALADEPPAVLPYRSRGAAATQADLVRAAALRGSFWEASAREVAGAGAQVGVQSCGQCGLSLSANARFCRRCGTPQAQSA